MSGSGRRGTPWLAAGALGWGVLAAASAAQAGPSLIEVPRAAAAALRSLDLLVEGGRPTTLRALATPGDIAALQGLGVAVAVVQPDVDGARPTLSERGGGGYHTPDTADALLRELAAARPEIARVVDVGRSSLGRPLLALMLTDLPDRREPDEPSLRVLGTHHGDEWSSMEVTLGIAEALVLEYGEDAAITSLLDGSEVWVVPVVNPDGVTLFTRRNARGVDLNRNYSHEWRQQTASGPAPFSEPETDAIRALAGTRSFGHSLSVHSGASNLGWVWNYTTDPTGEEALLGTLAQRYLDANAQPDFWITNGAAWYPSNGDTNDWSYGARGGHDYTLEVSLDKAPPEEELPQLRAWHVPSALGFLVDGRASGLAGRVQDGGGGGVEASITSSLGGQPLFADPETGAFQRPLAPGPQTITVAAPGYVSASLDVEIPEIASGALVLPVTLQRRAPVPIQGAMGLSTPADTAATACLRGLAVREHLLDAGGFALHRPGLGTFALSATLESAPGGCVWLALDPTVVPDAHHRVGAFTLVLTDVLGEPIDQRALAVAFLSPSPRAFAERVTVSLGAAGLRVTVQGLDLPEGGALALVGPDAVLRPSAARQPDGAATPQGVESLTADFDVTDWTDGLYGLRIQGAGQLAAVDEALRLDEGVATALFPPETGDDDDDSAPQDDDDSAPQDDDDSAPQDDDDSTPPPPDPSCGDCADPHASGALALLALAPHRRRRKTAR